MQHHTAFLPSRTGANVPHRSAVFFLRLFMACLLLVFTGAALAEGYYSRSYRKKYPRTTLSKKSKQGIARILQGEDAAKTARTAKTGNTLSQAKADTERYRLEQERNMAYALDDPDEMEDTPDYLIRAREAYRYTGDRNVKRFAEAVSEFQIQELRELALEHIDDPEKFNRYMAIISGKQYAPYSSIRDSGYVVNKSTGEISVGNPHAAGIHDKNVRADTARKHAGAANQYAKSREKAGRGAKGVSRAATAPKAGGAAMTLAEYREARKRAEEAGRPDIVRELDGVGRKMGYLD